MGEIGVVIVSFNTCEILRRCLRALAVSRDVDLAVVVVDNGSTDGSAAMVAAEFPEVRLLCNRVNSGFGAATNQGVRLLLPELRKSARNDCIIGAIQTEPTLPEYILLLNSDAFVEPDALAGMRDRARLDATAGVIAPQLRNQDGSLQPTGRPFPSLRSKLADLTGWSRRGGRNNYLVAGRDYEAIADVDEVPAACLLVRRAVFEQVGLFDEGFRFNYEDVDWCRRVADCGWRIVYLPAARVTHLWGASQRARRDWVELHSRRGMLRYFAKHGRWWEFRGLWLALLALDLARIVRWCAQALLIPSRRAVAYEKLFWRVRIFASLVVPQEDML